jgi:hypothetical protein
MPITIPNHGGGGIAIRGDGAVTIQNSIVAGNTAMTYPTTAKHTQWPDVSGTFTTGDISGTFTSLGGNLIGDSTGSTSWLEGELVGTAEEPIDALLDTLNLNDPGLTPTFALFSGSPAIDAVACMAGVTTDQLGITRPQCPFCDIGAFEIIYSHIIFMPIIFK